jgi:tetratricopeptide (TPR) repeat protein
MQESELRNLSYGDRDSLGLFQQRPSAGWGTPEQVMDPVYAAQAFFGGPNSPTSGEPPGLLDVDGWADMPLTQAAQAVQRSAFPDAYAQWWTACCRIHREYGLWPDKLRLVVFDNADAPGLNAPAEAAPEQMLSLTAPLDMRGAIDGILDNADDGSPGAEFRRFLVDLNDAIGRQQAGRMETLSDKAIAIAQAQQWTDMLATVYLLRAAGFLNMEHFDRALADYRHAQASAQQGEREDKPGCDKLHLQACMCEGTTLFSAGQFEAAATAYRQAAELAEAQQDSLMNLEGRRMESFCMERLKRRRQAWESANRALQVGRDMEETERHQSTLRFVGEALLRTAPDARNKDRAEQALRELLGPDWKQSPDEQAAAC